jgi:uncharacterized low-complexity protein
MIKLTQFLLAIVATAMFSTAAMAETSNPFMIDQVATGLEHADYGKEDGKCGEGKCGGDMKQGDAKCGGDMKETDAKCGGDMKQGHAKCGGDMKEGEGKCGGDMKKSGDMKDGKCGEGKCGGS